VSMMHIELLKPIAADESQTLEFKTSFEKGGIESLVAFAQKQTESPDEGVSAGANAAAFHLHQMIQPLPWLKTA